MAAVPSVVTAQQPPSLLAKLASRFSVEPSKMLATLKSTAFRGDVSNEQMMALLIVADQYGLNPWTKEVYAFPDKQNGIVPVVGVDGWARIINSHPQFDGMEFVDGPADKAGLPEWIECVVYRKDRAHPVRTREYMAECKRGTGPWGSHPRRMLRHKATIQCARLAFGFVGIYDQDEAERIRERDITPRSPAVAALNARIAAPDSANVVDATPAKPPTFAEVEQMVREATTTAALDEIRNIVPSVESADDDRIIRDTADACIALHAAAVQQHDKTGDVSGFWELHRAANRVQGEDRALLWEMLAKHSAVRAAIKEYAGYARAEAAKEPA